MQAFHQHSGIVVPFDRANIDTDAIIPKQFLKTIQRTGLGVNLFDEWRYLDHGEPGQDIGQRQPNPDFILNQPTYRKASILLARENFGCGSSREHAPWALLDFGIRAILAPSFADIFYNNCFKNGILPIVLPTAIIDALFQETAASPGMTLDIDLEKQTVTTPTGTVYTFNLPTPYKTRLLEGLDEIGITLTHADAIKAYEARRQLEAPWIFAHFPPR